MREFRRHRERVAALQRPSTSWGWILCIIICLGVLAGYSIYLGRGIELEYEAIDASIKNTAKTSLMTIDLPDATKPLYLPDSSLLSAHHPWMYVSKYHPLAKEYQAQNLVESSLPHAASDTPIKLEARTQQKLTELFTRAEADGHHLMIASAYRSIAEQQTIYDSFVEKRGEAAAKQYVALPGTSEHHTGYAVDVDNASPACKANSDKCELDSATIAWLDEHAPEYGFIIRFPALKEPITGTAYEPWHLRYVGVVLAKQLTASGMTFDEFIEQVSPGRFKRS